MWSIRDNQWHENMSSCRCAKGYVYDNNKQLRAASRHQPVVMLLRVLTVHLADVMADKVLLVKHRVVGAQEVVTLTEEAVVVHL